MLMTLAHFLRAGHRPIALIGGATGLIGDPSGRSSERPLLAPEEVAQNVQGIKDTLEGFFNNVAHAPGAPLQKHEVKVVNNLDWYSGMGLLSFLRDTGKHFRLTSMLARDSVQSRLTAAGGADAAGMSFTEFSYQTLQAYDFLHLQRTQDCSVQMGGGKLPVSGGLTCRCDGFA